MPAGRDRRPGSDKLTNAKTTRATDDEDGHSPLRVCYFGTYREEYARNKILINGLRARGVEVIECHCKFWMEFDFRHNLASGGWSNPRFLWRVVTAYLRLVIRHSQVADYDVMLIGYLGQFDCYIGRILTWWRRRPMVLDVLMSLHLIAEERGLTRESPLTGKLLFWLEKGGLKLPDLLIIESVRYEEYLTNKYGLSPARFARVPHGADEALFRARPDIAPPQNRFRVVYHGLFLPSHGMETIVQAASSLMSDPRVQFEFYGDGPERAAVEQMISGLNLTNVHLHGWVDMEDLLHQMSRAHICLGVFGTTRHSRFTIQNKIWEGLAMARPVVSGDNETIREALVHKTHIYLVEPANPEALASAIRELIANPELRELIARLGHEYYSNHHTPKAIGAAMEKVLRSLVQSASRPKKMGAGVP
ncbi:MAG: glycosyltransferase family 4 protein [Gammaproteobacteria bacterium]